MMKFSYLCENMFSYDMLLNALFSASAILIAKINEPYIVIVMLYNIGQVIL